MLRGVCVGLLGDLDDCLKRTLYAMVQVKNVIPRAMDGVKEKKYILVTLVKNSKEDFIQERLLHWGFCSWGKRLGSTLNTTRRSTDL